VMLEVGLRQRRLRRFTTDGSTLWWSGELGEKLATRGQLFLRYTTVAVRQRLFARLKEGTTLRMALEGLASADLAYKG
jgi:hypothetical protein